jgi:hypothetical protein
LAVEFVIFDLAVLKLRPGARGVLQFARSAPEQAAPVKSSLRVRLRPGGGRNGYRS